jgi:hypothetical protein
MIRQGGTFLLTVVTRVVPVGRRMAIPYKTEKTKEGEGVSRVGLDAVQGKGERGHMGCSPAIEGPCGGWAWWRWSVSTIEETGDQSWGRGRAAPTEIREEAGGGWPVWRRLVVDGRCGGGWRWQHGRPAGVEVTAGPRLAVAAERHRRSKLM